MSQLNHMRDGGRTNRLERLHCTYGPMIVPERFIPPRDIARYGIWRAVPGGDQILNQAVRRNMDRFPEDFMFRLSVRKRDL